MSDMITLPVDADGEVINAGDVVVGVDSGLCGTVEYIEINVREDVTRYYVHLRNNPYYFYPQDCRHYRSKLSVEDVLHDFAVDLDVFDCFESLSLEEFDHITDVINEYAAKLRLKEDAE